MFTYGYIQNATLARLDIDENEAQDMKLLNRFPYYANEAMQAICAARPRYDYVNVKVVRDFDVVVYDIENPASFFIGTKDVHYTVDEEGNIRGVEGYDIATDEQTTDYYHNVLNTYKIGEKYQCSEDFISFAPDKQAFIAAKEYINPEKVKFGTNVYLDKDDKVYVMKERTAKINYDYGVMGGNKLKFYHEGEFRIPAKFTWQNFLKFVDNNTQLNKDTELDIPFDILMTIPIYIASICLQIDNTQSAQLMRQEFELALARCASTDRMMQTTIPQTW